MRVGFGGYRISAASDEHKAALTKALQEGCSLVDTSSNYTDGQSELLIGEVLNETGKRPLIVTKAGYIQGQNLERFEKLKRAHPNIDYTDFNANLKHSVDPLFLEDQLEQSLKRLGLEAVDAFLLHNPEYFLKKNPGQKERYYQKIEKAFRYLQSEADKGKIKSFGVSSNTLVSPVEDDDATELGRLWEAAKKAGAEKSFKYIQFPMNLLEMDALQRQHLGKDGTALNLIEKAKELGLTTISNRPLNAFTSSGLLRLATYPLDKKKLAADPNDYFEEKVEPLRKQWEGARESEDDAIEDVPLFLQIKDIWHKQPSPDAVQQVFFGHFFPFVARVYGRDLNPQESEPFYDLYETALEHAKKNMNERAGKFAEQAESSGLLERAEAPLSQRALEKYAQTGVDYALLGMRSPAYVEDAKRFF